MDIRPGELIFSKDECPPLAAILSHYLRRPDVTLSDTDTETLKRAWARASDMSLLPIIPSSLELLAELIPHRPRAVTQQEIAEGRIAIPSSPALRSAIQWAAVEFVIGSPTHTSLVGQTLNSNYEDLSFNRVLGSTNESLAHRRAQSLLAAGQLATAWTAQLNAQ